MTDEEIRALPAGRELDALVAEQVMGWKRVEKGHVYFWRTKEMVAELLREHPDVLAVDYFPCPYFSTEIAAAWEVVEELARRCWHLSLDYPSGNSRWEWMACFRPQPPGSFVYADTAPVAICRAALLVVQDARNK